MANYLVDDTNMQATANAIRAKTGSSAGITFNASTGFKSAVESIITSVSDTTATPDTVLAGEIPVWKQPTGAQDAYMKGDKVHYPTKDDPVYVSTVDNNV